MKISIFGLGYVGTVSAACFANMGHEVIGVDPNQHKVSLINAGKPPVIETGLAALIENGIKSGALKATTDAKEAVMKSDVSFICVGTPSKKNGDINLDGLKKVCREVGAALSKKREFHVVVVRSTVLPGTMRQCVIPILEKESSKQAGSDFSVSNNPEFMRESTAVNDFYNPPKTVIGATDLRSGDIVQSLYQGVSGKMIRCDIEVGEMVKYADNAWHGVKVAFANEVGKICKATGIDSHKVMDIFCGDTKLNLSSYYLRPGFAFGGSCLPKDIRAINHKAQELNVATPLLESLLVSNEEQIKLGLDMIYACKKKSIGFLGISFKAGTDDLRESPMVEIVRQLLGKKFSICVYDGNVKPKELVGSNQEYIQSTIPNLADIMCKKIDEVLEQSEIIVIGNNAPEFHAIAKKLRPGHRVIDFVRIREIEETHQNYVGICW